MLAVRVTSCVAIVNGAEMVRRMVSTSDSSSRSRIASQTMANSSPLNRDRVSPGRTTCVSLSATSISRESPMP